MASDQMVFDGSIIIGAVATIIAGLWAIGRFIFKRGSDSKAFSDKLTLLENRLVDIEQDLTARIEEVKKAKEGMEEKIDKIKEDVAFIKGKLDE